MRTITDRCGSLDHADVVGDHRSELCTVRPSTDDRCAACNFNGRALVGSGALMLAQAQTAGGSGT